MNPLPGKLIVYKPRSTVDVVVFPTFLDLKACLNAGLIVGAQFGHPEDSGAHTGDVSMKMLKDLGCTYVLCGHSERRQGHGESNEFVAAQVVAALKHGLHPIVCVGETEDERNTGREMDVVKAQLDCVLSILHSPFSILHSAFAIAYEPVWAIGTGKTATPADAQAMHSFIRSLLTAHSSPLTATRILYGGSVKASNAESLLKQPDIDGALVGGASLDPEKFKLIIDSAAKLSQE